MDLDNIVSINLESSIKIDNINSSNCTSCASSIYHPSVSDLEKNTLNTRIIETECGHIYHRSCFPQTMVCAECKQGTTIKREIMPSQLCEVMDTNKQKNVLKIGQNAANPYVGTV